MANDQGIGYWMTRRAALTPERTALIYEDGQRTYGEFDREINRVAHGLRALGVNHGDRVAYLDLNHPRFFVTLFATAKLGAIFVPLNFRLTGPELSFIVNDAGVHTLVHDEMFAPVIDQIRAELPCRNYVCPTARDGVRQWNELTHGNFLWNNINALLSYDTLMDDRTLVVAPLFHIGGLNVTPLVAFLKGATVVLERQFDPQRVLQLIPQHRITTMFGVPAMFLFMSQMPQFADTDLSSVRTLICGGAPVPEALIRLYGQRGITFAQGYGLTETAPFASLVPIPRALDKIGSAGVPPFFTDVRCVDDQDRAVPTGERGEVVIKGPNVMKGYWNRPEATEEAIRNGGWFHSGDVGVMDEEGYLYIVDRKKDMIISGGENIYPAEVEDCIYKHPDVAEVAVIGVPDARWGETVCAIVVAKPGTSPAEQDIIDFTQGKLARYKQPRSVVFIDLLPRNPAGKVLKFELRDRFGGATVEQVQHERPSPSPDAADAAPAPGN